MPSASRTGEVIFSSLTVLQIVVRLEISVDKKSFIFISHSRGRHFLSLRKKNTYTFFFSQYSRSNNIHFYKIRKLL